MGKRTFSSVVCGVALCWVGSFPLGVLAAEGTISIAASPPLPAMNLLRNAGFEEPYGSKPVCPADWTKWSSLGWPDAERDLEEAQVGEACLRLRTRAERGACYLVQRIPGKTYAPGHKYIISFLARTEGVLPGRAILYLIDPAQKAGQGRRQIFRKDFTNTAWKEIAVEFTAPQEGLDLVLFLGTAKPKPVVARVWYDEAAILPRHSELSFSVKLAGLKQVKLTDNAGKVLADSGELPTGKDAYEGKATVSARGKYVVEAIDAQGKGIRREYPETLVFGSTNLIRNGGFEGPPRWQGRQIPGSWDKWSSLGWPETAKIDRDVFKNGKQSFGMSGAPGRSGQVLVQRISGGSYPPNQLCSCLFWGKTNATGIGDAHIEAKGRKAIGRIRFAGEDWKRYRFNFTTPMDGTQQIVLFLYLSNSSLAGTQAWWDDIVIRPLQRSEQALLARLEGIKRDITDTYRSTTRDRCYDVETLVDLVRFDVRDVERFELADAGTLQALKRDSDAIRQEFEKARTALEQAYTQALDKLDAVLTRDDLSHGETFIVSMRAWCDQWGESNARQLAPVEKWVASFRTKYADLVARVVEAKRAADEKAADAELARADDDLKAALFAVESADPKVREKGALELGRLEKAETVPVLMELLSDSYYPVRRNAMNALAWMRAENAVGKLTDVATTSTDPWMRRRATQAIGMIGSTSASDTLLRLTSDRDGAVRQNAVVSLGWLGERRAVPVLTRIAEQYRDDVKAKKLGDWQRRLAVNGPQHTAAAACQALGQIGDKSGLRVLMELAGTGDENVRLAALFGLGQMGDARGKAAIETVLKGRYRRWYTTHAAKDALYAIDHPAAGRTPGITQPEAYRQKRHFYWFDNHFHRGYGRWFCEANRPKSFVGMMRYAGATDGTEIITWRVPASLDESEKYFKAASANGVRCIPAYTPFSKATLSRLVHYYGKYDSFSALWAEECGFTEYLDDIREYVPRFIEKRFSAVDREKLGLTSSICEMFDHYRYVDPELRWKEREAYAVYAEAMEENLVEGTRELTEFLHMLRKGVPIGHYTTIAGQSFTAFINLALWGRMAHVFDYNGTEPSYNTASYENAMFVEMCRDGMRYPTGMEIYIWRVPQLLTRRWEVGIALSMLHSQQFYVWYWGDIFKQKNSRERGRPEAWEITKRMFAKAKKLNPYLTNPDFPRDAAVVHSGRTASLLYRLDARDEKKKETFGQGTYVNNNIGVYQALNHQHVQCDVIWADTLTADKIADYKVLVLSDAKTLTPGQEAILRDWVRNGGSLIVTGTTSLYDQFGRQRTNYGLAHVFGVDFVGNTCTVALKDIDSGKGRAKPKNGYFRIEPTSALGKAVEGDLIVEYDLSWGYDRVKPTTAKVAAAWQHSSDPAITINRFGKGHCLMMTATYPGLMWQGGRKIYRWTLLKNYRPGICESLGALARYGLALTNTTPCFEVANCPHYVEGYVRLQPEKSRMLFQLLNYDEQSVPVKGVRAKVRIPLRTGVRVFYPADDSAITFDIEGDSVVFPVRPFDIHEAVAIEYQ